MIMGSIKIKNRPKFTENSLWEILKREISPKSLGVDVYMLQGDDLEQYNSLP